MKLSFPLSVDYPLGHLVQGDLGDAEIEITDEEYELIQRWIYECGDPKDYPELQRVWNLLYAAGRKMLEEDEFADDPDIEHWDPADLEITIQYPNLECPDSILSELEKWNQYMNAIRGE